MWTLQDAKAQFSAVVDAALAGTPQEVTRRGRPAVVVVSAAQFARLAAGGPRAGFAEHLAALPPGGAGEEADLFPRDRDAGPRDVAF